MGRLGAMLGKLPSLEKIKSQNSSNFSVFEFIVQPDPLMVDGVKSRLATKRGVTADGASVVLGHLTIRSTKNCAEFS